MGEWLESEAAKRPETAPVTAGAHPAGGVHVDVLKHTLDSVLVGQPEGHHLKLQLADRTEDQIGIAKRAEQLRGALFAQL